MVEANKLTEEERKVLLSILSKLYTTPHCDGEQLVSVRDLAEEALNGKIASEASTRNALTKYIATLDKVIGEQPESRKPSASKEASAEPADATEDLAQLVQSGETTPRAIKTDPEDDDDITMEAVPGLDETMERVSGLDETKVVEEDSMMESVLDESIVDL
jgi:condensin complex subunit 3